MRDRELVGIQGGIKVLHHLKAHSRSLDLSHNHLLGEDGLRTILTELCRPQNNEVELESLVLVDCGLGGPGVRWSKASLELLAEFLKLMPNLSELLLTNNDLAILPPSFVAAVLSHSRLRTLGLSTNEALGLIPQGQQHSSIHTFLEAYHTHASRASSDFSLRVLRLDQTSLRGEELADVLVRIMSLNDRGLEELTVNGNEELGTAVLDDVRRAIELGPDNSSAHSSLSSSVRGNSFIVKLETRGSDSAVWVSMADPQTGIITTTHAGVPIIQSIPAQPRLDISARLHANLLERSLTRDAAVQLLRASRTLLHALQAEATLSAPSNSLDSPPPFRILDLPEEILAVILGAVIDASALSRRQTAAVLSFARDRGTLDAARRPRGKRLELQREQWLRSVGAWWYEP